MFPLTQVAANSLIGMGLFSVAAICFLRTFGWRTAFIPALICIGFLAWILLAPAEDSVFLLQFILLAAGLLVSAFAFIWAKALRYAQRGTPKLQGEYKAILLTLAAPVAISLYQLAAQYVPPSCTLTSLDVTIGAETYKVPRDIPATFRGVHGAGDIQQLSFSYLGADKAGLAELCDLSEDGGTPIKARQLWLSAELGRVIVLAPGAINEIDERWTRLFSNTTEETGMPALTLYEGTLTEGTACEMTMSPGRCYTWRTLPNGNLLAAQSVRGQVGSAALTKLRQIADEMLTRLQPTPTTGASE